MSFTLATSLSALGLFCGMVLFLELGRRFGQRRLRKHPDEPNAGSGPAEAAVFGLLGLLMAFTFSGAAQRFEERRHLITQEANAIGTAYLRLDLLPSTAQPEMRQLFRQYLDARISSQRFSDDTAPPKDDTASLQAKIWALAVKAEGQDAAGNVAKVILPAFNEMFDITTVRAMATENHPPPVIYLLLVGLSLVSALLVGQASSGSKSRNWVPLLILSVSMSLTFYVILDLEFPRLGLIRVDAADQVLIDLRNTMR